MSFVCVRTKYSSCLHTSWACTCAFSITKQQFVVTHRYAILRETEKTWQTLTDRQTDRHWSMLHLASIQGPIYFYEHSILTECVCCVFNQTVEWCGVLRCDELWGLRQIVVLWVMYLSCKYVHVPDNYTPIWSRNM